MRITGQEAIADAFRVAPKTIVEWQEDGFPVAERGGPGVPSVYELADCINWLVKREVRKVQEETPRDRLARVQAESIEMDNAVKRGQLIPADLVEPQWRAACVAARELLLRDRRRLATLLASATTQQQREQLILETHDAFLRRLANWRAGSDLDEAV